MISLFYYTVYRTKTVLPGRIVIEGIQCRVLLEGEITFHIAGERQTAGPGTFANMPVGVPHSFRNESGATARMLISMAPVGLEQMFFETGVPVEPGCTTAPALSHDEMERIGEAAPRYGIEMRLDLIT
jgi:hypothetical protein